MSGFVRMLRMYVMCVGKIITRGYRIWLSNIIVEEVIEVDDLNKGNTFAASGK